jgi:hypothetical protein
MDQDKTWAPHVLYCVFKTSDTLVECIFSNAIHCFDNVERAKRPFDGLLFLLNKLRIATMSKYTVQYPNLPSAISPALHGVQICQYQGHRKHGVQMINMKVVYDVTVKLNIVF